MKISWHCDKLHQIEIDNVTHELPSKSRRENDTRQQSHRLEPHKKKKAELHSPLQPGLRSLQVHIFRRI